MFSGGTPGVGLRFMVWQAVSAISTALLVAGMVVGAVVGLFSRPLSNLRKDITAVRTDGERAHQEIGGNIKALGEKLELLIRETTGQVEGKVDKVSNDLTEVRVGVGRIEGALPHIETRLSNLEG